MYMYFCICHSVSLAGSTELAWMNTKWRSGPTSQDVLVLWFIFTFGLIFVTFWHCCRSPFLKSGWTSTKSYICVFIFLCLCFIICISGFIFHYLYLYFDFVSLCFVPFLNSGWTSTVVQKLWAPFLRHLDRTTCSSLSLYLCLYSELQYILETSVEAHMFPIGIAFVFVFVFLLSIHLRGAASYFVF